MRSTQWPSRSKSSCFSEKRAGFGGGQRNGRRGQPSSKNCSDPKRWSTEIVSDPIQESFLKLFAQKKKALKLKKANKGRKAEATEPRSNVINIMDALKNSVAEELKSRKRQGDTMDEAEISLCEPAPFLCHENGQTAVTDGSSIWLVIVTCEAIRATPSPPELSLKTFVRYANFY